MLGLVALATACSDADVAQTPASTSSPRATSPTATVVDVDAADYQGSGQAGYYHWSYGTSPLRECAIYPGENGAPTLSCAATFAPGTPDMANDVFTGPPNSVTLSGERVENYLQPEWGPTAPTPLPVGHRITVSGLSCTTLAEASTECHSSAAGFRIAAGAVVERHDG
ncbi:hypothetical protein EF294_14780 [Gordonia oryzae]|uniref:Uncharacterized protein n=1 Tax=Gordonia oryzae TaxID=2487349 RepID=A0A3N4G8K3_9ACTN|nr:hypothetical protein EF294_14780 [Gordonia oryzae]